jgi:hypothetical protein
MPHSLTIEQLEVRMIALVDEARASSIPLAEIIRVLRGELEFVAELGNCGHAFVVTVIDLGDYQHEPVSRPHPERLEVLSGHGASG